MNALNCQAYRPTEGLACGSCGADIKQHECPQDERKMDYAADRVIELLDALGITREEAATITLTMAVNHYVATGVTEQRALLAVRCVHQYRLREGQNDKVLVNRR